MHKMSEEAVAVNEEATEVAAVAKDFEAVGPKAVVDSEVDLPAAVGFAAARPAVVASRLRICFADSTRTATV